MRKKNEFELEAIQCLSNLGYHLLTEKQILGSKSRPDLIAIKNNEALIIETKSKAEAKINSCLSHIDNISNWRKYCKNNYDKNIAVWMVHFGQIWSQNQRIGNQKGHWYIKELDLNHYDKRPCLICPASYKKTIEKTLIYLKITEFKLIDLSKKILLVKVLNKKQLDDIGRMLK